MDKKWAEVSLKGKQKKTLPSGKGSMVTAFPSHWDGEEWKQHKRMARATSARGGKKYYTKTHQLALRLCSLFPNNAPRNWCQRSQSTQGEKRKENGRKKSSSSSRGKQNKDEKKKLADEKCISMIFFASPTWLLVSTIFLKSLFQTCGFLQN